MCIFAPENRKEKEEQERESRDMNSQFSQKMSEVLAYSREEAIRLQTGFIGVEHLMLGMIRKGDGKAIEMLNALSVDLLQIKRQLEDGLKEKAADDVSSFQIFSHTDELALNEEAGRLLRLSVLEARIQRKLEVDTEHMLLAILKEGNNMAAN